MSRFLTAVATAALLALNVASCGKTPAPVSVSASVSTGALVAADFRACPQFFAHGAVPRVPSSRQSQARALCYDAFAVLHSGVSKTPVYVAKRLNRAQLDDARGEQRTNQFFADARLPQAERAQRDDYRGSGYDRGHMAPAGDMPTASAMAQSFSLANMVPQAPENNRHAWNSIEQATRKYVRRADGDVFVISGPVFGEPSATIGAGRVWVPTHLFKLVYDATSGRAWAHWIANTNEASVSKPITYAELVNRTGIEFMPGMPVRP